MTQKRLLNRRMIISHKLKIIFIKPTKVAGSSLQKILSQYCDPDDTVVPCQEQEFKRTFNNIRYWEHDPIQKIKKNIPIDIWNNYLKISIIRCPYDTIISNYYYWHACMRWKEQQIWQTYIKFNLFTLLSKVLSRNYQMLCIDNKSAVDFLIRYENFYEDIKSLETNIGCDGLSKAIMHTNLKGRFRPGKEDIYTVYSKYPLARAIIDRYMNNNMENELIQTYYPLYKERLSRNVPKLRYFTVKMADFLYNCKGPLSPTVMFLTNRNKKLSQFTQTILKS